MRCEVPSLTSLAARWRGDFTTGAGWRMEMGCQAGVRLIGVSERGHPLLGAVIGTGSRHATLIGGAHADEPVGPETLRLLVAAATRPEPALEAVLRRWRLWVVPHVNPDGEQANRAWIERWPSVDAFLGHVLREPPGRDVEFGFPAMRPENSAVTSFLARAAPVRLHASLHGMAFAAGAALLIERSWVTRTIRLRRAFSAAAAACGIGLHDEDRRGDKGFHYLERDSPPRRPGRRCARTSGLPVTLRPPRFFATAQWNRLPARRPGPRLRCAWLRRCRCSACPVVQGALRPCVRGCRR